MARQGRKVNAIPLEIDCFAVIFRRKLTTWWADFAFVAGLVIVDFRLPSAKDIAMRLRATLFASMLTICLIAGVANADPPLTHHDLDWSGPWRWVHIDNVDAAQVSLFESARQGWLATLRRDDVTLGDGRPLFWSARGDGADTYLTFYPFTTWADLDVRGEMVKRNQATVGEEAVKTYDTGDAALVPPHLSQIWRRRATADVVWAGTDSLTEVTAKRGRFERRYVAWDWDGYEAWWQEVREALVAQSYPLALRVFANTYGGPQGDMVLMWLAPDEATYAQAPTLADALAKQLGPERAAQLMAELERYYPVSQSWEMTRRDDMSNLGR